jgi:hypothetical protein
LAQTSAPGSISGKLTDLRSKPLDRAIVILRNETSGTECRTITARNGAYRFAGLAPGQYTLEAASETLGRGSLQGIVVTAGNDARMQVALDFEPAAPSPILAEIPPTAPSLSVPIASPSPPSSPDPMIMLHNLANKTGDEPATTSVSLDPSVAAQPISGLVLQGRTTVNMAALPTGSPPPNEEITAAREPAHHVVNDRKPLDTSEMETTAISALETITELPMIANSGLNPAAYSIGLSPNLFGRNGRAALQALAAAGITQAAFQIALYRSQRALDRFDTSSATGPAPTTTLTGEQLQSLPLAGRRWENFAFDAPPIADSGSDENGGSKIAMPSESTAISVDGVSSRLAFGGKSASALRSLSFMGPGGNEAAIATVRTSSGELTGSEGGTSNARMAIATGQGSLGLHGQAFLFDRQNLWGARNPFTQWDTQTVAATPDTVPVFTANAYTPPDREATWGIGLGSSLRRRRLFWFAALDGLERNDPGLATVKHPDNFFAQPSNDQMQVLSAQLGMSSANPVEEGLAAYSKMLGTLDGLLGPSLRTATQLVGFGRVDWQAAERHKFTLEGNGGSENSPGGGLTRASEAYGNHSFGSSKASEIRMMGRWEAFLTPNLLAVTQGSVARQIMDNPAQTPSAFERTLDLSASGQMPQIVVDSRYGFTIGNPARFGAGSYPDERLYLAQEGLDWVRGTMLVKAGFSVSHNNDATSLVRNHTGTYYYSSVENFASDALVFATYGLTDALDPFNQHNCDQTGKAWRDTTGQLHGLGYLPCYSYYSQTLGPTNWYLSTNDWAGYVTAQWQPTKQMVVSAALRWEREQMPPPIALVANPALPLTSKLPSLGNEWAPRVSMAWGKSETRWPVIRFGYGMYYGRTENSVLEGALTQTGSLKGDVSIFMRPTDNLIGGGAPPFPYVLAGEPTSIVKPGAVEMDPTFRNGQVHQGVASMEETLPGHVIVSASAMVSLARHLPITVDTNVDPAVNPGTITYAVVDGSGAGPIKTQRITVPFFASWPSTSPNAGRLNPDYQQISEIESVANSKYEAAVIRLSRTARRGLSLHARYAYAHAMDWNPNEGNQVSGSSVFDPTDFKQEYGTSNLDTRHSASGMVIWRAPWKLRTLEGGFVNGWTLSGTGRFSSGLPYTMRTAGSIPEEFQTSGAVIAGLGPSMNGYGGDNRVYGVGRNTYRYPGTWKADLRLGREISLGSARQVDLMAESFNLFNHQNVTELETVGYYIQSGSVAGSLPTLNFLTGLKTGQTEFGTPLNINATDSYRPRQIDFGVRMRF